VSYFSYGVSDTSRTLYETPALFPKVTICNANPFTTRYALEFLRTVNQEYEQSVDIFNEDQMSKLNLSRRVYLNDLIYKQAIGEMNRLNNTEKRKLSHTLDDMMPSCTFNIRNCTTSDFKWYFDQFYGNCWIFNSGINETTGQNVPLYFSTFRGELYGLQMNFYVNFYENLTSFNSYSAPLTGLKAFGALIRIENSSDMTSFLPLDGIKINPGHVTSISVSRSFKTSLPKPYSNCLIDNQTNAGFQSELFDLVQNSAYRYTQSVCFEQCMQKDVLLECNCFHPLLNSLLPKALLCVSLNETNCLDDWFARELKKTNYFQTNCAPQCPLECYFDHFDASLSFMELIPQFYLDYLNSNSNLLEDFPSKQVNLETARKSFVSFNIFYKQLVVEVSEESPQLTAITLFANMGSYLGLFLGVSVFSLFELIQVLIEIAFVAFAKPSNRTSH